MITGPAATATVTDLADARRVTFALHQRFSYVYEEPVSDLDHRLVVIPRRRHGSDRRLRATLTISTPEPVPSDLAERRDRLGNRVSRVRMSSVPVAVTFELSAVVERDGPMTAPRLSAGALTAPALLRHTRLTAADLAIRERARALVGRSPLATAEAVCGFAHSAIAYVPGSTTVSTTAAEALAGGRGVCQDHAHLMLAMCRAVDVPARYVSGHLLGEGATHAWVEVLVSDGEGGARAVAFDPCNNRRAGAGYVTVAVGRDYADVAPTSGSYSGTASSRLTATKSVRVSAVA